MTCRILVPPGIGDVYWVLVKLKSFLQSIGADHAELTIVSDPDEAGGHLRSIPYMQMFDWFDIEDPPSVRNDRQLQATWDEAYNGPGRSIFPGVMGYDYFLSWNGRVNSGGWIEKDDLACDWYPAMTAAALKRIDYWGVDFRRAVGRYVVLFWPFYGTYESHVAAFPIEEISRSLSSILERLQLTAVFIGSAWDAPRNPDVQQLIGKLRFFRHRVYDLIGKTDLAQMFGLAKHAELVLGYHAGVTNMAAVFGTKTLLLWDDRYPIETSYAVVPPAARGSNYVALHVNKLTVKEYVDTAVTLYES